MLRSNGHSFPAGLMARESSSRVRRIDLVIIAWTSLRANGQSLLVCGKSLALRDMISCRDFAISLTARRPRISLLGTVASRKDLRNRYPVRNLIFPRIGRSGR